MTLDELIQDEKDESFEQGRSEGIEIGLARGMEKGTAKVLEVLGVSEEEYQQLLKSKAEQTGF